MLKHVLKYQVVVENHGDKKVPDMLVKVQHVHHIGIMVVWHLVHNQEAMLLK